MKLRWKIAFFSVIGLVVLAAMYAGLYMNYYGPGNIKHMYTLASTGQSVVLMEIADGDGHYLTDSDRPAELLIERMKQKGWTYVQQEGSGYFFEKGDQKAIVTTRQWNHRYMIYDVNDHVVNLAD